MSIRKYSDSDPARDKILRPPLFMSFVVSFSRLFFESVFVRLAFLNRNRYNICSYPKAQDNKQRACLEAIAIELFDSHIDLLRVRVRTVTAFRNRNNTSVDTAEPSLPDDEAPAEPSGGRFQLGEGEHPQVVGPAALSQELERVAGVGVELGPPRLECAGRHAEGARPRRHLRRGPRNDAAVVAALFLSVCEVEALHRGMGEGLEGVERENVG